MVKVPLNYNRLTHTFAKAEVLTHLLSSRLAIPLLYPLNSNSHLNSENINGEDQNNIATSKWSHDEINQSLAHITPLVAGMTKLARVLKAGHALSYRRRNILRAGYNRNIPTYPSRHFGGRAVHIKDRQQKFKGEANKHGAGGNWWKTRQGLPADNYMWRILRKDYPKSTFKNKQFFKTTLED